MAILITHCPIRWQAINNAQSIALQSDQQQFTYQQIDSLLINLQEQLSPQIQTVNTEKQPIRLICIANNGIELVLLQLLSIRLGWLFCPLNPRFTDSEIKQRLDILNSDYCWVASNKNTQPNHIELNTLTIDFTVTNDAIKHPLPLLSINPLQPCNIIFTSGSSGFPKAIVHHYQNHFFSALGSQTLIPLDINDHNLLSLPLFHIGGYATVLRTMIAGACLHLTQTTLDLSLLQQRKITHLSLVSTQLIRLLADLDFKYVTCAIKHILLGGSAFSEHLLDALKTRKFNYHLSYGCTELASQVATSSNNTQLQLLPYRQIKIDNDEIYLRGETRFIGYFENNTIVKIDKNQWVASGDTGEINDGILQITGRKDRQFISGGENIKPEEIERICLQHPTIKQAYIYPIKDVEYGQRIVLFIAFYNENIAFDIQAQQLREYLKTQLTGFKQPLHYLTWPTFPDNNQALKVTKQTFQNIIKKRGWD
ncbi:AMP-binding protein [Psychromonas sp.]|nr:AMP-binding protein [Psychromonas sp.]